VNVRRLALLLWVLGACSARPQAPSEPSPAVVRGTVTFRGVPPKPRVFRANGIPGFPPGGIPRDDLVLDRDLHVRWAFVYVKKGLEARRFPSPTTPVVLQQVGLIYEPHVLGVQSGQPLLIQNLDRQLHVAHPIPFVNPFFGRSMPPPTRETFRFTQPEIAIAVKCDVHPWMKAWVGVVEHPFFSVTDEQGKFELINVPAGKYTVGVWHERLTFEDREIVVTGDTTMEFTGVLK
jgi:hypothetical protein